MNAIGYMPMPANFKYKEVFLAGRPRLVHFPMPSARRAKIFSPFDALEGFGDAVHSKTVPYEDKRTPEDLVLLNQTLAELQELTKNGKEARKNQPMVEIEYYTPCTDEENFAFGIRGQYETLSGICWNVDPVFKTIKVGETVFDFEDVYSIRIHRTAA